MNQKTTNTVGELTTVTGPMYAGKTSYLLQDILWHQYCDQNILVVKPDIDTRYSATHVETHNGLNFPCISVHDWSDLLDKLTVDLYTYDRVYLDEVQFLDANDTIEHVQDMLINGVDVTACGLDQDSRGNPFETTSLLLGLSDNIQKITSMCAKCGQPATKTQRLQDQGGRVEVGSVGMYEPRCRLHWEPR